MILVTGSNGQLGNELKQLLTSSEAIFGDHFNCDITNFKNIEEIILKHDVKSIINCAAYTAVDAAESNRETAFLINDKGVENLANLSKKYSLKLIHLSTDYVFDGASSVPLSEDSRVGPLSAYGQSKLAGEVKILEIHPTAAIIRTSWLYSSFGNNFVKTVQKLASSNKSIRIVFDQIGTPTNAADLAELLLAMLPSMEIGSCEIYHYSNEGVASWYDFALAICELSKIECQVFPIESGDYPTIAPRPKYSVLNKKKIKEKFNHSIPHWRESLKRSLS